MHASRPTYRSRLASTPAFSLIEVVLATGIFAFAIIAVVALLAPGQRQVANIQDAATASRLADLVRAEMAGYGFDGIASQLRGGGRPFELVASRDLSIIRSVSPVNLTVRVTSGTPPTASVHTIEDAIPANARLAGSSISAKPPGSLPDNSYGDITPAFPASVGSPSLRSYAAPGIAKRDRYFFVRLQLLDAPAMVAATPGPNPEANTGSVPIRVVVYYPFQVPAAGATDGKAEAIDEDDGLADPAQPDDFDPGDARDINGDINGNPNSRVALDAYLATLNQFTFNLSLAR